MLNVNYANEARKWSDAELSAVAKTVSDEQNRRSLIRIEGADPEIAAMLRKSHDEMYGKAGR